MTPSLLTLCQDLGRIQAEQVGPRMTSSSSPLTWEAVAAAWELVAASCLPASLTATTEARHCYFYNRLWESVVHVSLRVRQREITTK